MRHNYRYLQVASMLLLIIMALTTTAASALSHPYLSVSEALDLSVEPPAVITGASTLVRGRHAIRMTYHATGLQPGSAYTAWWVIFNRPEHCTLPCNLDDVLHPEASQSSLVWAAGRIANADGGADFSAELRRGKAVPGRLFGPGLKDIRNAEIHIVLRNHGAPITGQVGDQLTSLDGGCETECIDVQAAVHLPTP